jgi:hypothetical protein
LPPFGDGPDREAGASLSEKFYWKSKTAVWRVKTKWEDSMTHPVDRRTFLNQLTIGAAAAAAPATYFAGPRLANAAPFKAKGNVPDRPFKTGHITFLTGPANLLGEPGRKGHILGS